MAARAKQEFCPTVRTLQNTAEKGCVFDDDKEEKKTHPEPLPSLRALQCEDDLIQL